MTRELQGIFWCVRKGNQWLHVHDEVGVGYCDRQSRTMFGSISDARDAINEYRAIFNGHGLVPDQRIVKVSHYAVMK